MENRIYDAFEKIKADEELRQDTLKGIYEKANKKHRIPLRRAFAAVCASLFLVGIAGVLLQRVYYAENGYIDIDVNPSIELTINRFDRIIDAHAYNEDGRQILNQVNLKHKPYDDAVNTLLRELKSQEYIIRDGLVSATLRTDWKEEERLRNLEDTVADSLKETHSSVKQEIYAVDSVTKDHAHEENISPAKYIVISELQELEPERSIEECKSHTITEIREEIHSHGNHNDSKKHD